MSELKPCPFCGGRAHLVVGEDDGGYRATVYCTSGAEIGCFTKMSHWALKKAWVIKSVTEAWNRRAQPANEPCADCSGIVYRQTASGKIIPADQRCAEKITPPCYQSDGDGCAYQIYGDNNDEPIDQCKACPLCYSDKVRHITNKPLMCDGCEHQERFENEREYGYPSPCTACVRVAFDCYRHKQGGEQE